MNKELSTLCIISCARLAVTGVALVCAYKLASINASGWGFFILAAIVLGMFSFHYNSKATCPKCGEKFIVKDTDKPDIKA